MKHATHAVRLPAGATGKCIALHLLLTSAILVGGWGAAPQAMHHKNPGAITTFDVPGAGGYTVALAINEPGAIAGAYQDTNGNQRGFILSPQGSYTTFDAPGAVNGTFPSGIDQAGTVVGTYADANQMVHGFSLAADGTFTQLTGPGGLPLPPAAIAATGGITGTYTDINGLDHGFRLSRNGAFLPFEAPNAGIIAGQGTQALSINRTGQIAGTYADIDGGRHAYVRAKNGSFTTLAPPGNLVGFSYVYAPRFVPPIAINAGGFVAGSYFQVVQGIPFGGYVNVFIQQAGSTPVTFGIGDNGCCIFTYLTGLNASGTTTGYDDDEYDINHGFVRTTDGTITTFDAPGAGTSYFQGTLPTAINSAGTIIGTYEDENYAFHGFIRQP